MFAVSDLTARSPPTQAQLLRRRAFAVLLQRQGFVRIRLSAEAAAAVAGLSAAAAEFFATASADDKRRASGAINGYVRCGYYDRRTMRKELFQVREPCDEASVSCPALPPVLRIRALAAFRALRDCCRVCYGAIVDRLAEGGGPEDRQALWDLAEGGNMAGGGAEELSAQGSSLGGRLAIGPAPPISPCARPPAPPPRQSRSGESTEPVARKPATTQPATTQLARGQGPPAGQRRGEEALPCSLSVLDIFKYECPSANAQGGTPGAALASCAAHTDNGLLTLIPVATGTPGLHVYSWTDSRWLDLESGGKAGEAVVFAGEALRVLSRGLYAATPHKVAFERAAGSAAVAAATTAHVAVGRGGRAPARCRLSTPFLFFPRWGASIVRGGGHNQCTRDGETGALAGGGGMAECMTTAEFIRQWASERESVTFESRRCRLAAARCAPGGGSVAGGAGLRGVGV